MQCQNCHRSVGSKSKFCPHCGKPIALGRGDQERIKRFAVSPIYAAILLAAGVALGYLLARNSGPATTPAAPLPGQPAVQSVAVVDIARSFMCPCGKCDDRLDECTCDEAVAVKRFIAQRLGEGHKKPHIMEMVKAEYGEATTRVLPVPFDFKPPERSVISPLPGKGKDAGSSPP